jgi:two-component system LytT family response regulator/two-component system response regulator LytT
MEIRTIYADDEQLARDEIGWLLQGMPNVQVVGQAGDGVEAFHLIEKERPDLVLLDIEMPGLDGFQLVREINALEHPPRVIFVTAYDRYALQAFEVSAVDYLMKPVSRERLEQAIDKVRAALGTGGPDDLHHKLTALLSSLPARSRYLTKIPVRRRKHLLLIDVRDVLYSQVKDGLVFIVTSEAQDMVAYRTLDEFASELDPDVFHRVHRSYLANVNHIREIIPLASGNYELVMDDAAATHIPLSRQHSRELRRIYRW